MLSLWHIELLGGLRIISPTRVVTHFRIQKAASLLFYLTFHLPQSTSREALGELLWPETEPSVARARLRVVLNALRRELDTYDDSLLVCDRASIGLNAKCVSSDVGELRSALQNAKAVTSDEERLNYWNEILTLYRGPLLPGFYDEWIESSAVALEDDVLHASRQAVLLHEKNGQFERALEIARRGVEIGAGREDLQREVLRLLGKSGDVEGARRQWLRLSASCQKRGVEPEAQTRDLWQQIQRNGHKPMRDEFEKDAHTAPLTPIITLSTKITRPEVLPVPLQWTRFFGRGEDIKGLAALWDEGTRLITLTGSGGSGKTRIAVEAARAWQDAYEIAFVRLEGLTNSAFLLETIAGALKSDHSISSPSPSRGVLHDIADAVAKHNFLLILDNFEHLVEGGAPQLRLLLSHVPHLRLLVTSRIKLQLEGEREWPISPLPLPPPNTALDALLEYPSIQLFADRAVLSRPGFALSEHNAQAVIALCARLDGLPLALELAGAHADVLSPSQMLTRLDKHLDLNTENGDRHNSLRATWEWSFELLSPELRHFLAQLSIFQGGWGSDECQIICDEPRTLHFLSQLRSASLVSVQDSSAWVRFNLLETLRIFVKEHLKGPQLPELKARHARCYLDFAEGAAHARNAAGGEIWNARLDAESDNIRTALQWALGNEVERVLSVGVALADFWYGRGRFIEGSDWLGQALGLAQDSPQNELMRARALEARARLLLRTTHYDLASECAEAAAESARALNDPRLLAGALTTLGLTTILRGDFGRARNLYDEAAPVARGVGDETILVPLLQAMTMMLGSLADWNTVRPLAQEQLLICRRVGTHSMLMTALITLAQTLHAQGEWESALATVEEALPLARATGEGWELSRSLWVRANIARELDEFETALSCYAESLEILSSFFDPMPIHIALIDAAFCLLKWNLFSAATSILGCCSALRQTYHLPILPMQTTQHGAALVCLRAEYSDVAFERVWSEGEKMPLPAAIALIKNHKSDK